MKRNFLIILLILSLMSIAPFSINSQQEVNSTHYDQEILVEMYQFSFDFTYNGTTTTDAITLYTGITYLFNSTSIDIQHGFGFLDFTVDPLLKPQPGEYIAATVRFNSTGTYSFKCTVNCNTPGNTGHGTMNGEITVLSEPSGTLPDSTVSNNVTTTTDIQTVTTTEQVVSNQTFISKQTVTETLVEQLPISLLGIVSLILVPLLRKRYF